MRIGAGVGKGVRCQTGRSAELGGLIPLREPSIVAEYVNVKPIVEYV